MSATALLQGSDVVISDEYTFRLLRTGATVRPLDATDAATVPIDVEGSGFFGPFVLRGLF